MPMRLKQDVVMLTLTTAIILSWLLFAADLRVLSAAFAIAILSAALARVRLVLALSCLALPLFPIVVSHLLIEPLFSGQPVNPAVIYAAVKAWLRVGGMALLSVSWLASLNVRSGAQLCQLIGAGQYLLLPFMVAGTFVSVTRDRWLAIRELQALRTLGTLRRRTRIKFRQIPNVGLQLTMASLISSGELALACNGRGIGARRTLAVPRPTPSASGVSLALIFLAATAALAVMRLS